MKKENAFEEAASLVDKLGQCKTKGEMLALVLEYRNSTIKTTEPKMVEDNIYQYSEELFVVFDPTDGGSSIVGAYRTLEESKIALDSLK